MSTTDTIPDLPPSVAAKLDTIGDTTKKGFNLKERLQNRGLRKGSITLYLNEELGPELGDAYDVKNHLGGVIRRERTGIIGDIERVTEDRDKAKAQHDDLTTRGKKIAQNAGADYEEIVFDTSEWDTLLAELEQKKAALVEELDKSAITIHMRAVPPVIQKDCRRKAKATIGWEEKGIPAVGTDEREEFNDAFTRHLMTLMFQSVRDHETNTVNDNLSYEDAVALTDLLPPSQFNRLDIKMGEIQFTDAISQSIESQEDFS